MLDAFDNKKRCNWVKRGDPLLIAYHDKEWGRASYDAKKLFEMLILEGAQAGLNWRTVLQKREGYKAAFHHFDIEKMAAMTEADIDRLAKNPAIIRNRLKIKSAINNARVWKKLAQVQNMVDYLWSFVDYKPIRRHHCDDYYQLPSTTKESDTMSRALKEQGFSFVGGTICYAFMQAVGMVDDHTSNCFLFKSPV
ncbi:MAG: DNA-3-methyladenine glycosylase I [Francisellaceae bacterium]